jgi:Asp-tRNA(Asn)/Glu-tRNA(Gln) amidotransferase A subunit family amidase
MGSAAYAQRTPSASATVVQRLEAAGAFVLAKTVTAELAFYAPGKTRNPWNPAHTPGGSSSGSAAAVAAGFVPAALGTQTNGSIIRPAAFCGCVGFKPSFGRIPRPGVLPFSGTLDTVGFFTRSVADAALLLDVCAGPDPGDPASALESPLAPRPAMNRPPRLVAVRTPVWEHAEAHAQEHFEHMLAALRAAGADVEERALPPAFDAAHATLRTIMYAEGARSFAPLMRTHGSLLSEAIRALIDEGSKLDDERLGAALQLRLQLIEMLRLFLQASDAIVTLPATGEAPDTRTTTGDPRFCTLWSLCGVPALVLPSGRGSRDLPLGTQLVGKPLGDVELLRTAAWCEEIPEVQRALAQTRTSVRSRAGPASP